MWGVKVRDGSGCEELGCERAVSVGIEGCIAV